MSNFENTACRSAKLLLGVSFILISLCAWAGEDSDITYYDLAPFPACKNRLGIAVQFVAVGHEEFNQVAQGLTMAAAVGHMSPAPLVFLDKEIITRFPAPFQRSVFFHECAHHEKGHILPTQEFEDEADCESMKSMKQSGELDSSSLDIVKRATRIIMEFLKVEESVIKTRLDIFDRCASEG